VTDIAWNKSSRAQLSIVKSKNISTRKNHDEVAFDGCPYFDLLGLGGSARVARDNAYSVEIFDVVQIGDKKLKPVNYKVEWHGTGPAETCVSSRTGRV